MEFRRRSSHQFLCQKWTIFSISVLILLSCVLLAGLSHKIAQNYANNYRAQFGSDYQKDSLEQALIGMAVTTGFFALFGVIGALRESYCSVLTFTIYITINTVANIYVALRADGLWLYALLHLCIAVIAFSFTKSLRARRLLRSSSSSVLVVDTSSYPHQTVVAVPIVTDNNYQQWTTCPHYNNHITNQWIPSQPPPYEFPSNAYQGNNKRLIP